jgi:hypothetical protein
MMHTRTMKITWNKTAGFHECRRCTCRWLGPASPSGLCPACDEEDGRIAVALARNVVRFFRPEQERRLAA